MRTLPKPALFIVQPSNVVRATTQGDQSHASFHAMHARYMHDNNGVQSMPRSEYWPAIRARRR